MLSLLIRSNFAHSVSFSQIEIVRDGFLGVNQEGEILFLFKEERELENWKKENQQLLGKEKFLEFPKRIVIPGLIDTHVHAPQYVNAGTGQDLPLLEWLEKYTFPTEAKYSDPAFAKNVYEKVVKRAIKNGITTSVYFSSIHRESTELLVDILKKFGSRALVGKVCMDRHSPTYYVEKTEESLAETEAFVKSFFKDNQIPQQGLQFTPQQLVLPIITPRFAPTCTPQLLAGLGEMAKKFDLPIQSHISENLKEVEWVKELFPKLGSYAHVYQYFALLNSKTIMAHGCHLTDAELEIFKQAGTGISHCPVSNFGICSGMLDVRKIHSQGIKLGLGTDMSGGYSPSILEVIRQSIITSTALHLSKQTTSPPISFHEAFYLATMGGGSLIGLENKLGNFQPGKWFDALVINPEAAGSPFDIFPSDQLMDILQKFLYNGDDRNVEHVYVQGRDITIN